MLAQAVSSETPSLQANAIASGATFERDLKHIFVVELQRRISRVGTSDDGVPVKPAPHLQDKPQIASPRCERADCPAKDQDAKCQNAPTSRKS